MFKKIKYLLLLYIFPPIIALLVNFIRLTSHLEEINKEAALKVWEKDDNLIVCFWHGRLLMMPFIYKRGKGKVLISRHRDGEFIARVIRYFGLGSIRGSYKKGGIATSREVLSALKMGYDVAITPDGPKGPRYKAKKGIVELARLANKMILPVAYSSSKKRVIQSWDRFLLPYPFSRIVFVWGEPISVSKEDDIEKKRLELEESLINLTEKADRVVCGR